MLQQFDERNRDLIVNVGGRLTHRDEAAVNPFDSAVQGGDAVWEGLRVHNGRIFRLTEHLARLRRSARALAFESVPSDAEITEQIRRTLAANEMTDGVHIRLTLTRGVKITSGMDPRLNQSGPTLIVLPEYKAPVYDATGITLITSSIRRPAPDVPRPQDPPQQPAAVDPGQDRGQRGRRRRRADARPPRLRRRDQRDQRVLRDRRRARHTDDGRLPRGDHPRDRARAAAGAGIECAVGDYSLVQLYTADEVFVTGTMGGIAPVISIDGRVIGDGRPGR